MFRRHNIVSARLGLGYRPPWQIVGVEGQPPFTECQLCRAPLANTIDHVPLFDTSYSMVCRCMLSVIIFWSPIFSMLFSDVTLDLVTFPDTLCPAWHRLL